VSTLAASVDRGNYAAVIGCVNSLRDAAQIHTPELRVQVFRNVTLDRLVPYLELETFNAGVRPSVEQGGFDTYMQELMQAEAADVSLLFLYPDGFFVRADDGFDAAATHARMDALLASLAVRSETLLLANFAAPESLFVGTVATTGRALLQQLNQRIRAFVDEHANCRLLDVDACTQQLGDERSFDHKSWYRFRAPHSRELVDLLAAHVGLVLREKSGRQHKCLVLDCDNTLWGGVVGEVGLDGLKLDQFDGPGRAYTDFQRQILALQKAGVMVALLSKNNEADVLEVLDAHPHCLLHREHLVGWKIDWADKPSNLRALAGALNIGTDAMVFIDDSDFEVHLMRESCPEVTTMQVPKDASHLPNLLATRPLFALRKPTAEDRQRTRMYQDAVHRQSEQTQHNSVESFLQSLGMTAEVRMLKPEDTPRVTQLLARTNQFRLTSLRPDEEQVRALEDASAAACYTLRSADKFGELGLVGVLIVSANIDALRVDALAVSCRALGRCLERCLLLFGLRHAAGRFNRQIIEAHYEPSAKNQQVDGLLEAIGLASQAQPTTDGIAKHYRGDLADLNIEIPAAIKVIHD
jgi:FkbH-like protein